MSDILLRFRELKARRIVTNHPTLKRWIEKEGFPPGILLGPNTRVWREFRDRGVVSNSPNRAGRVRMEQRVEPWLLTTSIAFPIAIGPGWQVAYDRLQWVLQRWRTPRWRDRAFCRTRSGLELRIGELIGREHQDAVAHLPDWHPDVDGVPEPRRLKNGRLDLGGRHRIDGQKIREQVLAQLHLPNPITIALPDGTTTCVWLATGKDGKKKIGDALWWRMNCAGRSEPAEVVKSPETRSDDPITLSDHKHGCEPELEYYEDGYPKLPACLDRRRS